jgi:hypothetical protein
MEKSIMTRRSNRELWVSFVAILGITIAYLFVAVMQDGVPRASDFFGHTIGIFGFLLMLMTETLYSLRKRSRRAQWGRMAEWLNFHIFTGLVGPYMVLLHTSWKFNGLAGIVTLLTVMIVVSGFIGRYIYTAVPRTADGIELEAGALERRIAAADQELSGWLEGRPEGMRALSLRMTRMPGQFEGEVIPVIGRAVMDLGYRAQWWVEKQRLDPQGRRQAEQLERLLQRRRQLDRQVRSLAAARRLLALWHAIHIPIGMVLFTAAFIHILAAIYYATLLR